MAKKISELSTASTPLDGDELVEIVQDGTSKKVQVSDLPGTGGSGSGGRDKLGTDRNYYVRTDGNNGNDGLSNTSGGAFLTIQKAVDVISADLDIGPGVTVTINVADGTYTTPVILYPYVGAGSVSIVGNTGTPENVVISTTSANAITLDAPATYSISGVKITTTTAGSGLVVSNGGVITFDSVNFGACYLCHMICVYSASITASGNYSISGGAGAHVFSSSLGAVSLTGRTVTITGTPAFSSAFVWMSDGLGFLAAHSMTFSGSATGKRYIVSLNSVCFVNGGGANYFPGNVAGTSGTGGQYS